MTVVKERSNVLQERDQNYWQLTCIQGASLGITGLIIAPQISRDYGAGVALTSIWVGNVILWVIALAMVSMTFRHRENAIENVESYLGKPAAISSALILILSFIGWYILQINAATDAIKTLIPLESRSDFILRMGAALGFLISLIAMGGITIIRRICVAVFPFLLLFYLYMVLTADSKVTIGKTWGFSLIGIIAIVQNNLVGIINIPTFFRHSRSKQDAILALILMTFFVSIIQSVAVFIDIGKSDEFFQITKERLTFFYIPISVGFIIISVISVNLVNVYFASAGWEMIIPHVWSAKEYAIVGLLGTAAYTFLQISSPMEFLENMSDNFIANIGIALLMTFLIRIIVKHRPRKFEMIINTFCWAMGCAITLYIQIKLPWEPSKVLLGGVTATVLSFLSIVFIEETIWSVNKIISKRKLPK